MTAPVLALHGIGGGAALWGAVAARLPLRAWDQPGYGGTALPAPLHFAALADAVVAALDEQGWAQADLVGHSMGGMIALEAALRHPSRVRRLALVATTPAFGGRDPGFAEAFLRARLGPLEAGGTMADSAAALVADLFGPDAAPALRDAARQAMAAVPEATYRATLRCLTTFDRRADLPRVAQPTLCVAGAHDAQAPERTMRRMADAIPGARFLVLPTGHMPHLEAPEALASALAEFLA